MYFYFTRNLKQSRISVIIYYGVQFNLNTKSVLTTLVLIKDPEYTKQFYDLILINITETSFTHKLHTLLSIFNTNGNLV